MLISKLAQICKNWHTYTHFLQKFDPEKI